jgi:hypothetical protein
VEKVAIIATINGMRSMPGEPKPYTAWRIGITNDPDGCKKEWAKTEEVYAWGQYPADSLEDAQAIESHFIDKKMKRATSSPPSGSSAVYVYIF